MQRPCKPNTTISSFVLSIATYAGYQLDKVKSIQNDLNSLHDYVSNLEAYATELERNGKTVAPSTVRGMLDSIDQFLATNTDSKALWDVLTSLRGPDSYEAGPKEATVSVLRMAAFPKAAISKMAGYADAQSDCISFIKARANSSNFKSAHFHAHLQAGFKALGLLWGSAPQPLQSNGDGTFSTF